MRSSNATLGSIQEQPLISQRAGQPRSKEVAPPRSLHIVLLNQAFYPDIVATAQMAKDLADHLARRGHRVSAIASRSIYGKVGAVLPKRETVPVQSANHQVAQAVDNPLPIQVHRVGFSIFGKRGTLARLFDFALFYALAAFKLFTTPRADIIVGFSTPPFIALLAVLVAKVRRGKSVYWAMDLYPDVPVASGMLKPRSPLTRMLEALHRWVVRHADATVALGRCMRGRFLSKGLPEDKLHFIPVWSDESGVRPLDRATNPLRNSWGLHSRFTVMYSGNFGLGHDSDTIKAAMLELKASPEVRFVFVGGGKRRAEIESFVKEHRLEAVKYYDYVPREQLAQSLCVGDVHLISLREGMEGLIVPSKLFGIMAAGRPAIFIGHPDSEIARVLVEHDAGIVVREADSAGLVAAIMRLAADPTSAAAMGERARAALLGKFDATTACSSWAQLLERLCGPAAR